MIDLLSLPRRHNLKSETLKSLKMHSGLPINSLPGWEHIPLNSKLPMLKCPGNEVIFSKNKIGQSFKSLKQEFDPSGRDSFPEYNPLHDSNLRTFYSNERNLKRLRENNEITQNNDVICNLKDFNEYRLQLHKSQLYYILHEMNRLEGEQHDRMLIAHAEAITNRDHRNLSARQLSYTAILARRLVLEQQRREKYQNLWQITLDRMQRIEGMQEMKKVLMEHRKLLNKMRMQRHHEVCQDLQRKHLIMLKKLFQFKDDRFKKSQRALQEQRTGQASNLQIASWEKRLAMRIENEQRMQKLLKEANEQRKMFIESHRQLYKAKWDRIQEEIKQRARRLQYEKKLAMNMIKKPSQKRKAKRERSTVKPVRASFCSEYQQSFERVVSNDLCEVLNVMLKMDNMKIPLNADDPICKAAKFISRHIIDKFDKDLSSDELVYSAVAERIERFFDEAKSFVMFRASQIIASIRESKCHSPPKSSCGRMTSSNRGSLGMNRVSFRRTSSTIGLSSYEIHPFIDLRSTANRTPTPAGSLASIVVDSQESTDKVRFDHLTRNDVIFIEHYVIKFKHHLIVGVGRRVFSAINAHYEKKIMDVRKELLEIDKKFLVHQATKAILSYAINPLNFETSLKICTSALASDVIWSLQKHLLPVERDPRIITQPKLGCACDSAERMKICLFCN